jgi:hypothetical protein
LRWVDRARERHPDLEVIGDAVHSDRMRTAACDLVHNRGALQVLEVVCDNVAIEHGLVKVSRAQYGRWLNDVEARMRTWMTTHHQALLSAR